MTGDPQSANPHTNAGRTTLLLIFITPRLQRWMQLPVNPDLIRPSLDAGQNEYERSYFATAIVSRRVRRGAKVMLPKRPVLLFLRGKIFLFRAFLKRDFS